MSVEDSSTSQPPSEDVNENTENPEIGKSSEETEPKGPSPLFEDTEEETKPKEESSDEEEGEESESEEEDVDESDKEEDKEDKEESEDFVERSDDSLLSDADMERILSDAKEEGLSKEAAQKQVNLVDDLLQAQVERSQQAHQEIIETWASETKADKEVGGEKYNESIEFAKRAVDKFGTEKFKESSNSTGFGNNAEVVRVFSRIGREMSSGEHVAGGNTFSQPMSVEERFYGKSK